METGLTKNQHYVPRFYLKAWADDNDFLWAKIDGQIRHVNILNIAQEKYFYRDRPISLDELKYIFEFQKKHYKGTRLKTNLTYVAGSVFPIILQCSSNGILNAGIYPLSKIRLSRLKFSAEKLERTEIGRPFFLF